jgi:TonB family protein
VATALPPASGTAPQPPAAPLPTPPLPAAGPTEGPPRGDRRRLRWALLVSLLLHALPVAAYLALPARPPAERVPVLRVRVVEEAPAGAAAASAAPGASAPSAARRAGSGVEATSPDAAPVTAGAAPRLASKPMPPAPLPPPPTTDAAAPTPAESAPTPAHLPAPQPQPAPASPLATAVAEVPAPPSRPVSGAHPAAPAAPAGRDAASEGGAADLPDAAPAAAPEAAPAAAAAAPGVADGRGDGGAAGGAGVAPAGGRVVNAQALDPGFRLVAPIQPRYPAVAQRLGRPGVVELELEVAPDGRVATVRIVAETPGWGFGAATREAYAAARFSPPTVRGEPVRVRWRKTLRFRP